MPASASSADSADDATLVDGASAPRPAADAGAAGVRLGRYVVIEHAGSGAMGSVLRAYDPRLHREIAIKRVRAGAAAERAHAAYVELGGEPERAAEVAAWIAERFGDTGE